jgi:hypothetical protein
MATYPLHPCFIFYGQYPFNKYPSQPSVMKKISLVLILALPLMTNAQAPPKPVDSIAYYQKAYNDYWRQTMDSIKKTEQYITLQKQLDIHKARSKDYSAVVTFIDIIHSDLASFNESIAISGFPALNDITGRVGVGSSSKAGRFMFDFYFAVMGINNSSTKDDEKIKTSLTNVMQCDFGIDVLKSDVVSLYPYGGLSLRVAALKYDKPDQTNPGYTNISNIITSNQSVRAASFRLGYQAGLGIDIAFYRPKGQLTKDIFFIKAGTNGPVWKDSYKIGGIKYQPGIKHGDWLISFGVKLATRG